MNPVDTYIRSGTYARLPNLPYTPGGDCAGVVEKVASDVTDLKVRKVDKSRMFKFQFYLSILKILFECSKKTKCDVLETSVGFKFLAI